MTHGQFCSIARAQDVLGGRWTLLVVRELLSGSRRFNEIRRGIPRISRTVLSERLQALTLIGAAERKDGSHGPEYFLTDAGRDLAAVVGALGTWGQRWLPRDPRHEDLDIEPVLMDMQRRVRAAILPPAPFVVRFELGRAKPRFMLLKTSEVSLCSANPGFPEMVCVRASVAALVAWWRGDASFAEARRMGLALTGNKAMVRAFPEWFDRYLFAEIPPRVGSGFHTLRTRAG
jgi:DNA-binding HxlR family transcriptional regulator